MKNKLTITIIQTGLYWGDKEKNIQHFNNLINQVQDTDIILLPELFNTSFIVDDVSLAEKMEGVTVSWMKLKSKEKKSAIAGTLLIKEHGKIYNRLVWISKSGSIQTYDKRHLFSLVNEHRFLTKGKQRTIIIEQGWKICPLICYDLRFPVFSRNDIDYDLLIYLANWPIKRINAWNTLLEARSIENQCYTIGVNRIGQDGNGVLFDGHSKVFDAFGKELYSVCENKQKLLNVEICKEELTSQRKQLNFLKDRDDFSIY